MTSTTLSASSTPDRLIGEWRARNAALKTVLGEMKVSSAKSLDTQMERHLLAMYQIERNLTGAPGDVADALGKLEIALHYADQDATDDGEGLDPNWQMVESAIADLKRCQADATVLPGIMVAPAVAAISPDTAATLAA